MKGSEMRIATAAAQWRDSTWQFCAFGAHARKADDAVVPMPVVSLKAV
jgi:hypothetical protein